jgi:hypothetical protein
MRAMIDTNLRIAFADGEIRAADLLKQVGTVQADALSDLSVASKDAAATADASKTPDANAPGKPLDVLSSNAELNKNITDLLTKQQTQIELLSRQLEAFSSNIEGKLTQIIQPDAASQAPAAAKSGFLANISPAWGALGALGAAGAAGGGGAAAAGVVSAASSGPVNLVSLSLTGTVTLGPMLAANQLRVVAYDRDGKILGSDETVEGTTGAFEIKITNGYSGVVIFKVLDGNPNEADYMDEATQRGLSLGKTGGALPDLRAIVVTEGIVPKTVHINPLTELAAVKSGLAEGSVVTTRSSAELLTISRALAKTLALSTTGQLLSDIAVIPTVNLDGSTNASANDAGKLLDTISQLEKLNNFTSPTAAIATVAGQLQEVDLARGESGFKDPTVTNVAQFQTAVLQTPPTIAGVTFSADTGVSGTDLITSNGTQNITVKFSKALESTRTLSWKTTDSGVWSAPVAGNGTDTLVLTGASLSSGSRTLQFRYTSTATSLSEAAQVNTGVNLVYILDTTAPTTPVVTDLIFSVDSGTSGTDLITNSAAQTVSGTITSAVFATERIFGSVDGGGTWSEIPTINRITSSVTGATTFNWNVTALVNQTATGTKSLVFQVRDAAGNVSSNSNATPYVLDTAVPDNSIDLSTITISSDTGTPGDFRTATKVQTISAQLGKRLDTSPANGETLWGSVDNGANWTDLNGFIANRTTGGRNLDWTNVSLIEGDNTIVFKITDVAGNTLAALGNRTYFLETLPPPPTLTLAADTGVNTNDGITSNGRFNVTDVLSGHTWQYSLNGGTSWTAGSGTSFIAPAGSYASGAIQLRQTSEGGLVSSVDQTRRAITIDTSAAAPTLALAADTGDNPNDFITNNGTINVTGLETGATWRYRLGGGDWQTGGAVVAGGSSFVLPSSGLLGTFYAASEIQVQQTDLAGNTSAITSYGNAVRVRTTPPDMSFASGGGLSLSADSGTTTTGFYSAGTSPQNNDWLTNITSQIIRATLSQRLATGDRLLGSIDNGVNFRALNLSLATDGTTLNWTGVSLLATNSANSRIILKVVDIAGNESVLVNQAYSVDTTASNVALDSGAAISLSNHQGIGTGGRFYTTASDQRIQVNFTRSLVTVGDNKETLWASTDTGTSWVDITTYLNLGTSLDWLLSASGTTLTVGANQLQLKVTDKAGNATDIANVAYTLVTTSYLTGLTGSAVAALGSDVALLTAAQVAQLGQTQLDGLTDTQIGQLASASPSRLTGLSAAQIGFLGTNITGLSADQVAALSTTQIGGLTAAQIAALSPTQFDKLNTAQLEALTEAAIGGMTNAQVDTLIAADVQALGTDIKGLTIANVKLLSTAQVQALTTAQVQALTNTQVAVLTATQVGWLSTIQVQALTNTQVAVLTAAQIAALSTAQFDALSQAQLGALTEAAIGGMTSGQVGTLTTAEEIQALGTDIKGLTIANVALLSTAQVQALTTDQLNALNDAGLLDDITQALTMSQLGAAGLNLSPAVNTADRLALFNSALQAASGTAPLNLNNIASGAAAVVAAVSAGTLTVANLTNLGLTGVTSTNLTAIGTRIATTIVSLVNSMSELRAMVTNASGELADRYLNGAEAADGVTVAVALDGVLVGQTITLTLSASGSGAAQTIPAYTVTSTDLANGFASINISQAQLSASGQGSKTVTASIGGNSFFVDTFVYDTIAPTFSSLTTATVVERSTGTVYDAQTTEGDTGMSYTLSGVDANFFNINATTGAVTFKASPNFFLPQDNGNNNVYDITVRATDLAGNFTDRAVALTVVFQPVLDTLGINNGAAVYSLRLLDADYADKATKAIRVRRSITPLGETETERDIGFTASGELDTAALLLFVGTGNGFVTTWYDQSGNGRNATQTDQTKQPRIVSNGAIETQNGRPAPRFDGDNDRLVFLGVHDAQWSLAAVGRMNGGGGGFLQFGGTNQFGSMLIEGGTYRARPSTGANGDASAPFTPGEIVVLTATYGVAETNIWKNGIIGTPSAVVGVASNTTSYIGALDGIYFLNGNIGEIIVLNGVLSTTDRQTLEINQGLYYDTNPSGALFGLWQSDGAGNTSGVTKTTTDALQTWSAQLVSHASQTNNAGTFNGSNPLSQYINRVTGTDIVSDTEFKAGFTITGKAATGLQSTIRFYLDNDRTNGTDEIGTQLTNGSNGVTWTYNNTTGDYTITFAAESTALKQATHNTYGSGVHKLTVDNNGDGVMQAGEASRLFLVASGTAQTSDTGQVGQNYSVQDRPSGNVFVYFYGDPDGNGIGLWTRLDSTDTASNPGAAATDRDGAALNSIVDWDYYNTGVTAGTQATTANTALGFVTSIAAQVWEFQMGQSASTVMNWSTAKTWAGDHTARGSNTSRMASLAETLALYAANFAGGNTPGAVDAMSNLTSTTTVAGENHAPGGWGTNIWTAAPTPSGNAVVSLSLGHVLDDLGSAVYRVSAVL